MEPLGPPLGGGIGGVIEEFSTRPLPIASIEQSEQRSRVVFDIRSAGGRMDLCLAHRWRFEDDPRFTSLAQWGQFVALRRPTRLLVIAVFLHESLAAGAVPETAGALSLPGMEDDARQDWDRLLPSRPRLEILGPGLGQSAIAAWDQMPLFIHALFRRVDWSPREFVGYRAEETYPVWGCSYWLTFAMPKQARST